MFLYPTEVTSLLVINTVSAKKISLNLTFAVRAVKRCQRSLICSKEPHRLELFKYYIMTTRGQTNTTNKPVTKDLNTYN